MVEEKALSVDVGESTARGMGRGQGRETNNRLTRALTGGRARKRERWKRQRAKRDGQTGRIFGTQKLGEEN